MNTVFTCLETMKTRKYSSRMRIVLLLTAGGEGGGVSKVCVSMCVCVCVCPWEGWGWCVTRGVHPSPVNRMTDKCKNIAFPQLRLRMAIIFTIKSTSRVRRTLYLCEIIAKINQYFGRSSCQIFDEFFRQPYI